MTEIMPALALGRLRPGWHERLTPAQRVVLPYVWALWRRPDQRLPRHRWRSCGLAHARGTGKTRVICEEITRRVEAGEERLIGLLAPAEERTEEVQIAGLIAAAPPWFKPVRKDGGLVWPNGVVAECYTANVKDAGRGSNFSLTWATEIVAMRHAHRLEAMRNMRTATRAGPHPQILWDSTSKGRNDVLEMLRAEHAKDPHMHVILEGTIFSNPIYSDEYLRAEWSSYTGVRREEELLGKHFSQAAGALWAQALIDATRVDFAPTLVARHVAIDPASSVSDTADETGLCLGGRAASGHVYVLEDKSGKHAPERWGDLALDWMPAGGQCTIETNQGGDAHVAVLRSRATNRDLDVVVLGRDDPWPQPAHGVVQVRRQFSRDSKGARAEGPAAETEAGRVHLVGDFPDLEREMTTYVPGEGGKSPNRLDAMAMAVAELAGLCRDAAPDTSANVAAAAQAHQALVAATRGRGVQGRRLGL